MAEKKFWKFLGEGDSAEKLNESKEKEFLDGVTDEFNPDDLKGLSRRKFLALSAATLAITTTACKNYRDKGAIVPYNSFPENSILGIPNFYASTCTACSNHCGILIKTREGRPIKIDGNPDNKSSYGKICSIGQANILNLYHPERYKKPLRRNGKKYSEISWDTAFSEIADLLSKLKNEKKEIAILTPLVFSPTFFKLLNDFKNEYPSTKIYSYDYPWKIGKFEANEITFGKYSDFNVDLSQAKVILSIESNFLATDGDFIANIRNFTKNRSVDNTENFSRFYAFETDLSLTGANADFRIPLRPDYFLTLLFSIISEIITKHQLKLQEDLFHTKLLDKVKSFSLRKFSEESGIDYRLLNQLVDDLVKNLGKSIVIAGDYLPKEIHLATHILNKLIGGIELYRFDKDSLIPHNKIEDFKALSEKISRNEIGGILNFDTNFVFHFPEDFSFFKVAEKVPLVVTFAESENDSAIVSHYIIPKNHNFESWGDFYKHNGKYSTQQPVIEPIFGTYQIEDFLLGILNGKLQAHSYHQYLVNHWQKEIYPKANSGVDFQTFWSSVLHDGYVELENSDFRGPNFLFNAIEHLNDLKLNSKVWFLVLKKAYNIRDGRFINNPWLMELPHPISKITWDNYAGISENSARALSLTNGSIIRMELNSNSFEIPVFVVPGIPDNCLVIELGFGQKNAGVIGSHNGFNPNKILSFDSIRNGLLYSDVSVRPVNKRHNLASTVEHHSLNDTFVKDLAKARHIIQEGSLADYISGQFHPHRTEKLFSIIPEIKYQGVKWAMVIDLNKCVGCGACITACNVENNVPVVGKDQVQRGREMHWIRIDTYFSGTEDNPEVFLQPMLCQHCDDAPCENVCPVVATNHSPDGLNQMVYNRCVGTRYCSNNCPYKVRRFNFYDFRVHFANGFFYQDSLKLLNNPEVTVRSRGVMEKCTFCIQRISEARRKATEENRTLKGTDVKTACQEACPAEAIIFGDMHDKDSELFYWRNHKLGYYVLDELNIKPNVTYIAKLKNNKGEGVA
ncbi:MAG: 4Fe-4S dicluster domain-containing protein [Candidatus Kapaibacteriales bacterium]